MNCLQIYKLRFGTVYYLNNLSGCWSCSIYANLCERKTQHHIVRQYRFSYSVIHDLVLKCRFFAHFNIVFVRRKKQNVPLSLKQQKIPSNSKYLAVMHVGNDLREWMFIYYKIRYFLGSCKKRPNVYRILHRAKINYCSLMKYSRIRYQNVDSQINNGITDFLGG